MKNSAILLRWLPAAAMMALIFAASSIPGGVLDEAGLSPWGLRKIGHLLGYALLGASYAFALRPLTWRGWLLAWGLAALYAATDEFHQRFTLERGGSPLLDLGIDSLGAALGLALYARLKR